MKPQHDAHVMEVEDDARAVSFWDELVGALIVFTLIAIGSALLLR